MAVLSAELVERVLAHHPVPIADAMAALVAAEGPFERRDRIVEVFRAVLRVLAAVALAGRVQYGAGPGPDGPQVAELLRGLRARGLTDGQWMALLREALRPWEKASSSHPIPALVTAVHARKAELPKLCDELLVMRKSETVAHGATGTKDALEAILAKREPQLARILELTDPLWQALRLALPLAKPPLAAKDDPQPAWLLAGDTPPRGRWRRIDLAPGPLLPPGDAVLVDAEGKAVLALAPILLVRPPSPDAPHEVFALDGSAKRGALYVAFPSMAEHREADAWKLLDATIGDAPPPSESGDAAASVDRPWRGLASFGPEHAALFFGREEQTEALANRIRRHPLVTVTGPSGAGKTSLLCAGVMPQMPGWRSVVVRPGSEPLENLSMCLAEEMEKPEAELLTALREDPRGLGPLLAQRGRETGRRLVLIVDQMEEVFTLCHDEAQREAFAIALASAESDVEGPIRVVLGVREDFFGRLATLAPLRGLYSRQVEVVTTPDRESLGRTLLGPAKHFGYAFEDEELLVAMVDAVAGEPAALALLSFCADRLWEARDRAWKRLTWRAYEALGGVAGALASHADRVVGELTPAQRIACRAIFLRLVTAERTRAVVPHAELVEGAGVAKDAEAVLDRLVTGRLLTAGDADLGARVEIVHEALIRHWGQLVRWLDEDVEGQRLAQALRQAAREWDARDRRRGLLWRGDVLEELRLWRKRAAPVLTGIEAGFAEQSLAEERRGRWIRRSLVAGALVATAAFALFLFIAWRAAEEASANMAEARTSAEIRGLVSEARTAEPKGDATHALSLLRAAAQLERGAGQRGSSTALVDLERLARASAAAEVLAGHTGSVWAAAVSPDARRVLTVSLDGTAKVWEIATGASSKPLEGGGGGVLVGLFTPDGRYAVIGSSDLRDEKGEARIFDASTGALVATITGHQSHVRFAAISPKGDAIVTGSSKAVLLSSLPDGARRAEVEISGAPVAAAFSPDGARFAVVGGSAAFVYDARTGARALELDRADAKRPEQKQPSVDVPRPAEDVAVAFAPDGAWIAVGRSDGAVRLFDSATGKVSVALDGHTKAIHRIAFSRDGKRLATASADGTARLWALDGSAPEWPVKKRKNAPNPERPSAALEGHTGEVADVAFSADGARVATGGADMTARVWDVATGSPIAVLRGHAGDVRTVAWAGERLATASSDKTARVWTLEASALSRLVGQNGGAVSHLVFSPDGARVAIGSDRRVRVVDLATGAGVDAGPNQSSIRGLAFSPDSARVASSTADDNTVHVWDAKTGAEVVSLAGHEAVVNTIVFSRDGARIATASGDKTIRLFRADGTLERKLEGHGGNVAAIAFSPDGAKIASGSWDKTGRIWDVATGAVVATLGDNEGWVSRLTWAPEGTRLATVSNVDAKLWDASGKPIATLHGHEDGLIDVAFSPDGARIATAGVDATVRLWSGTTGAFERTLKGPGPVLSMAFSPDGGRIAGAVSSAAVLWDVASGGLLDTWITHTGNVVEIAFSPKGDLVVTGGTDGLVGVFRPAPADRARALATTGAATNLRVCRASFEVVPVLPFPDASTVWAPEAACRR